MEKWSYPASFVLLAYNLPWVHISGENNIPVYQVCWAGEGGNNSLVVAKVGKLE